MSRSQPLLGGSLLVIRLALLADGLFLAGVVAGLAVSAILGSRFTAILLGAGANGAERTTGMRFLLAVGVVMGLAMLVLLRALFGLVASMRSGDPFSADNAARLQRVGWSLLALQLLDIPCALIARFFPSLGDAAPGGAISLGGWMAVLMAFVLARAFAAGTVMRDDLKGTV